ncbi:ElyC/SanA/YdcF family protein [Agromyces cerinus]|uniref:ElyC/SanA/YdcF family protein n=1 Tax=Agromyces cerinus TaxID=33878 RepID=UPI00094179DF|nr:ElyC/SanA/YdcF family protein [Agromyces cerinus]
MLGYRNRGGRANSLNRYRVRAGLRSQDPRARESVLVLCGGGVASATPEAELMASYARRRGYTGPMRLDRDSATTWENIRNAIPLIEDADTIKIVSNSLHAEKGRAFLWKLRPDLAGRLVRAEDHRFGELALVKPLAAVLGLRSPRGA